MTFYVITGILLVFLWIRVDFLLGERRHKGYDKNIFYPARNGEIEWFDAGKPFFDSFFEDVKKARYHIHIMFYIFRNDGIGSQLIDLLVKKAAEGVEVRVLIDWVGSGIDRKARKKLKENGVQFSYSKIPSFPFFFYSLNRRNHRKITVIDGRIGYMGGFNIGDEYLGRDTKLGFWKDFHLRFQGEGTEDLQEQFLQDWTSANQPAFPHNRSYFPVLTKGPHAFQFLATNGTGLEPFFLKAIQKAQHFIYIGSPYFIPSRILQDALLEKAKHGVNVRIILPEKKDHPLVKEASYSFLREALNVGVMVYHYKQGFFHAKALLIDNEFCDVGTANFDRRSFFLNNEMNALLSSPSLMTTVKETLEEEMAQSTKLRLDDLEKRPLTTKIKEKIAHQVEGLL